MANFHENLPGSAGIDCKMVQ
ncbi:uncharacterized protein G2W53_011659 [Senna tora]|uniref:Uncharacterized protein n=1 Tax=Senna tora TaxID=362788 RepID=A0A834X355_9FABA|nr:uncharacterized protein G2W53_011659 [Senna tora]